MTTVVEINTTCRECNREKQTHFQFPMAVPVCEECLIKYYHKHYGGEGGCEECGEKKLKKEFSEKRICNECMDAVFYDMRKKHGDL